MVKKKNRKDNIVYEKKAHQHGGAGCPVGHERKDAQAVGNLRKRRGTLQNRKKRQV